MGRHARDQSEIHTVLAVDFDGTICELSYPSVGKMRHDALLYMNKLFDEGFGIVIHTCREGKALAKAIKFLDKHGFNYDYYNCNFPHLIQEYQADCRKISADLYIDDRNLDVLSSGMPSWLQIYGKLNTHYDEKIRLQTNSKDSN